MDVLSSHRFFGAFYRAWFLISLILLVCIAFACERPVPAEEAVLDRLKGSEASGAEARRSSEFANRPLPPEYEPEVRVRVVSSPLDSAAYTFGSTGQQLLLLEQARHRPFLLEAPVVLEATDSGWTIREHEEQSFSIAPLCPLSIRTPRGVPKEIAYGEILLPGAIELHPQSGRPSRGVDLVVHLPIERYLPGVLDGELYGTWPLTSFQAQAVAARSFALAEAAFWENRRHFDLVAGPASQAWSGLGNSERAQEAVATTRGILLLHEGRVIPAYYSACCGGVSASAVDAISNHSGHRAVPLQARAADAGVCCEDAPLRTWTVEFDLSTLKSGLRAWGQAHRQAGEGMAKLGLLHGMSVLKRNSSGRPLVYELVDRSGTRIQVEASVLRRALGTVKRSGGRAAAPLYSEAFEGSVDGAKLTLRGRGYGHGVGLCQFGAKTMGVNGVSWQEILGRYYPEAQLESGWSEAEQKE